MPWTTIDPDRAWTFDYVFDQKSGARAATCAVKLRDGELVVLSPARGVTDADFAELETHGRPVALVAPNGFHHLGLPEWHRRYPDAKLYAPAPAAARISKKQPGLGTFEPLSKLNGVCPDDVAVLEPPGMRIPDVVARVKTPDGWIWSFNDIVMNIPKVPAGFFGKVMQWTDSAPGFKVARFFTMMGVKDKKSFKPWLLSELAKAPPVKIVTAHGPAITDSGAASRLPEMVDRAI